MTPVQAIQKIVEEQLSKKCTFLLGDLNSANLNLDKVQADQYPVCILMPMIVQENQGLSGLWKSQCASFIYFVDRDKDARTVDYKDSEIDASILQPMRLLAREFLNKWNKSDIVDTETDGRTVDSLMTPIFQMFDAHVYGVLCQATLKWIETTPAC